LIGEKAPGGPPGMEEKFRSFLSGVNSYDELEQKLRDAYAEIVKDSMSSTTGGQGGSGGMDMEAMIKSSVDGFLQSLGSSWIADLQN